MPPAAAAVRVACIGECMIELSEPATGPITRGFGGDTLNTAVYLARLGVTVDYITGLGDDDWSAAMLQFWRTEGVGTDHVLRLAGRVPGLYIIQTNATGERRFSYWRDQSPARDIFQQPTTNTLCATLATFSHIYLSGISLSLYGNVGRSVLAAALDQARRAGTTVVFDTNFRARGWPDREAARTAYTTAIAQADLIFASIEDLTPLFGPDPQAWLTKHAPHAEIVLKLDRPACVVISDGTVEIIEATPVPSVIDTTAAGDSFAAGYLAARIAGESPADAAACGHRLAGIVVQHRGAIIPLSAMPTPSASS